MKKIEAKEMQLINAGSAATRMCFFSPTFALFSEAFGNIVMKSIGRGTLTYCLEN
ncbi:MAG: hypothetical protein ACKOWO_02120 [Sediminibacterium sp.]